MKNINKLFAIAIVILGFSATSFAQSTATASATAVLVTPISIANNADMNFGTVASSATAGTVALDYANTASYTGGASFVAGGAPTTNAQFTVTGEGTSTFSITYPTSIILAGSVAGNLTVNNILADCGAPAASVSLVDGTKVIKVKGTLVVPAGAVAGTYTNADGLFVTVNYN